MYRNILAILILTFGVISCGLSKSKNNQDQTVVQTAVADKLEPSTSPGVKNTTDNEFGIWVNVEKVCSCICVTRPGSQLICPTNVAAGTECPDYTFDSVGPTESKDACVAKNKSQITCMGFDAGSKISGELSACHYFERAKTAATAD